MITQKAKTTKSLEPIEVKINKTKYHVKRRQNEKKNEDKNNYFTDKT